MKIASLEDPFSAWEIHGRPTQPLLQALQTGSDRGGHYRRRLGSHALRHAFKAILKKKKVRKEDRADLRGHLGKTETSERYCEATEIADMYELVCKMPTVTGHLIAHPINLAAWITDKRPQPFSRPGRAKNTVSNADT